MRADELIRAYELKPDDELLHLATQPEALTPEALSVLRAEMFRRRLNMAVLDQPKSSEAVAPEAVSPPIANTGSVTEFMLAVTRLYRDHFWLFIKLVTPAVVIGYVAITAATYKVQEISSAMLRNGPQSGDVSNVIVKAGMVRFAGYFISWMAFCFSFAAISEAVAKIRSPHVSAEAHAIYRRTGNLIRVSLALGAMFLLALLLSMFSLYLVYLYTSSMHSTLTKVCVYAFWMASLLVLSRFALAIPAVVVGGCNVRTALFRSDELTEGKWLHLAALLTKGIVGGYVAGMLPFWIAQWIWNYVPIPSLALRIASVMAVIPIEPVMFIGFSLMYVAGRAKQSEGALFTDIVAVS